MKIFDAFDFNNIKSTVTDKNKSLLSDEMRNMQIKAAIDLIDISAVVYDELGQMKPRTAKIAKEPINDYPAWEFKLDRYIGLTAAGDNIVKACKEKGWSWRHYRFKYHSITEWYSINGNMDLNTFNSWLKKLNIDLQEDFHVKLLMVSPDEYLYLVLYVDDMGDELCAYISVTDKILSKQYNSIPKEYEKEKLKYTKDLLNTLRTKYNFKCTPNLLWQSEFNNETKDIKLFTLWKWEKMTMLYQPQCIMTATLPLYYWKILKYDKYDKTSLSIKDKEFVLLYESPDNKFYCQIKWVANDLTVYLEVFKVDSSEGKAITELNLEEIPRDNIIDIKYNKNAPLITFKKLLKELYNIKFTEPIANVTSYIYYPNRKMYVAQSKWDYNTYRYKDSLNEIYSYGRITTDIFSIIVNILWVYWKPVKEDHKNHNYTYMSPDDKIYCELNWDTPFIGYIKFTAYDINNQYVILPEKKLLIPIKLEPVKKPVEKPENIKFINTIKDTLKQAGINNISDILTDNELEMLKTIDNPLAEFMKIFRLKFQNKG